MVPGAAASPGANNCNFTRVPALTVKLELVFAVLLPSLRSVPVTVALPAVFKFRLKLRVPSANGPFAGNAALLSELVIPTVSPALLTRFQFASTALTVTLNAVPATWAEGVPALPLAVPGAAVSPGVSTCIFTKAPGLTAIAGLTLGVVQAMGVAYLSSGLADAIIFALLFVALLIRPTGLFGGSASVVRVVRQ